MHPETVTFTGTPRDDTGGYILIVKVASKGEAVGVECLPYRIQVLQVN